VQKSRRFWEKPVRHDVRHKATPESASTEESDPSSTPDFNQTVSLSPRENATTSVSLHNHPQTESPADDFSKTEKTLIRHLPQNVARYAHCIH
jgi:hypothetical protein